MALPKFLQTFLPSYKISRMDLKNPYDKKLIIEAVLNRGNMKDLKWLFKVYNLREIKQVVKKPSRGVWRERALNYWLKIFDIKLPKIIYRTAIKSLRPDPKIMRRYFAMQK